MDRRKGILSLALLLLFLMFAALPLQAEELVHVVAGGETIYSIARSVNVDPGELMRLNSISDASRLQVGKRLRIPGTQGGSSAVQPVYPVYQEYRVVRNETLYSIARNNNTTVQALLDANGFSQSHVLKEGESIRIPAPPAAVTGTSGNSVTTGPAAGSHSGARQTTAMEVDRSLRWPVNPREIAYMDGKLPGVMVTGERTEPVRSLTQGTVISAGPYRGFGRVAIVQVAGGYLYVYGGCESLSVKEGDRVSPGTEIGRLGIDAVSDKPQLFFLVFLKDNPIDPSEAPRA
jgi:murein DD-endopeptidase MepM/ murein hydrolase activator NlpD